MDNFFPAFICVLCLVLFVVVCLGTGLGLINPVLGVLAIISCVIGLYSVAGSIE